MSYCVETATVRRSAAARRWVARRSPKHRSGGQGASTAAREPGVGFRVLWIGCLLLAVAAAPGRPSLAAGPETTQLERALELLRGGRYGEALAALRPLRPRHPELVAIAEARCDRAEGRLELAERRLRAAAADNAGSERLAAERAGVAFERGRYEEAGEQVREALRLDPASIAARWWQAELHRVEGRLDLARPLYDQLVDAHNRGQVTDVESLRWIGLAAGRQARLTGNTDQFRVLVTDFYPACLRRERHFWQVRLDAARLLMEKYNQADALVELNAALAINPRAAEVHAARAELALQDFDLAAADAALRRALEINPRLLDAHRLRADWQLVHLRYGDALRTLNAARRIHPRDEATLGRLAAVLCLRHGFPVEEDSAAGVIVREVTERNPRCGEFFAALAATLDLTRRYPQAAEYYEEARRRLPELAGVSGKLGLTLLRLGEEVRAAELLRQSAQRDPFNVRVRNSLEVLEVLDGYAVLETEHFVLRFDRGRDELLAQYAADYLESSVYPEIVERLGFEPEGKTLIEIFSRARNTSGHGWFSARMAGLPRIGTVAACAGRVVALVSPNDTPQSYGWGRVLRHEFVHVVNLQQTGFNIPHWFTEALAVFHEDRPRPPAWNRVLATRFATDRLFTLKTIDLGFLRPRDEEDWTLAYCQAELYAEFMRHEFGAEATQRMLAAYADHLETPEAIRQSFGVEAAEFEQRYREFVRELVESHEWQIAEPRRGLAELERLAEERPTDADVLAELAEAHLSRGAEGPARKWAEAARRQQSDHPRAAYVSARLAATAGDDERARSWLRPLVEADPPHRDALVLAASLQVRADQGTEAARLYRLGLDHYPLDEDLWLKSLARVHIRAGDEDALRQVLQRLVELDDDSPSIRKKLAQLALAQGDFAAAEHWAHQALQIDVGDAATHAMLAEAFAGRGRPAGAAEAYRRAVRLDPRRPDWQLALARSLTEDARPREAAEVLKRLLRQDPENPEAAELLKRLTP